MYYANSQYMLFPDTGRVREVGQLRRKIYEKVI